MACEVLYIFTLYCGISFQLMKDDLVRTFTAFGIPKLTKLA